MRSIENNLFNNSSNQNLNYCNDYEFLEKIKEQIDEENHETGPQDDLQRDENKQSTGQSTGQKNKFIHILTVSTTEQQKQGVNAFINSMPSQKDQSPQIYENDQIQQQQNVRQSISGDQQYFLKTHSNSRDYTDQNIKGFNQNNHSEKISQSSSHTQNLNQNLDVFYHENFDQNNYRKIGNIRQIGFSSNCKQNKIENFEKNEPKFERNLNKEQLQMILNELQQQLQRHQTNMHAIQIENSTENIASGIEETSSIREIVNQEILYNQQQNSQSEVTNDYQSFGIKKNQNHKNTINQLAKNVQTQSTLRDFPANTHYYTMDQDTVQSDTLKVQQQPQILKHQKSALIDENIKFEDLIDKRFTNFNNQELLKNSIQSSSFDKQQQIAMINSNSSKTNLAYKICQNQIYKLPQISNLNKKQENIKIEQNKNAQKSSSGCGSFYNIQKQENHNNQNLFSPQISSVESKEIVLNKIDNLNDQNFIGQGLQNQNMNSDYTDISNRQIKFSNPSLSNKQSFQNLNSNMYQAQNFKENEQESFPVSIRTQQLQKSVKSLGDCMSDQILSQHTSALNELSNQVFSSRDNDLINFSKFIIQQLQQVEEQDIFPSQLKDNIILTIIQHINVNNQKQQIIIDLQDKLQKEIFPVLASYNVHKNQVNNIIEGIYKNQQQKKQFYHQQILTLQNKNQLAEQELQKYELQKYEITNQLGESLQKSESLIRHLEEQINLKNQELIIFNEKYIRLSEQERNSVRILDQLSNKLGLDGSQQIQIAFEDIFHKLNTFQKQFNESDKTISLKNTQIEYLVQQNTLKQNTLQKQDIEVQALKNQLNQIVTKNEKLKMQLNDNQQNDNYNKIIKSLDGLFMDDEQINQKQFEQQIDIENDNAQSISEEIKNVNESNILLNYIQPDAKLNHLNKKQRNLQNDDSFLRNESYDQEQEMNAEERNVMSEPEIKGHLNKERSLDKTLNFISQTTFYPNQSQSNQGMHPLLLNENSTDRTLDNNPHACYSKNTNKNLQSVQQNEQHLQQKQNNLKDKNKDQESKIITTKLEINILQPNQSNRSMKNTRSYSDMFLLMNQHSDDNISHRSKSNKNQKKYQNPYQLDNVNQNLYLVKNNEKVIKQFAKEKKKLLNEFQQIIKDRESQIQELKKELDQIKQHMNSIIQERKSKNQEEEIQIEEFQDYMDKLADKNFLIQEHNAALKSQVDGLQNQINQKILELQNALLHLEEKQNDILQKDVLYNNLKTESQIQIQKLQCEYTIKEQQNSILLANIQELKADFKNLLNNKNDNQKHKKNEFQLQIKKLIFENDEYSKKNIQLTKTLNSLKRDFKDQQEASEEFQTLIIDELLSLNDILMKKKKKKKLEKEMDLSKYVDLSDISKATFKNSKNQDVKSFASKIQFNQGNNSEKEARLLNLLSYIQKCINDEKVLCNTDQTQDFHVDHSNNQENGYVDHKHSNSLKTNKYYPYDQNICPNTSVVYRRKSQRNLNKQQSNGNLTSKQFNASSQYFQNIRSQFQDHSVKERNMSDEFLTSSQFNKTIPIHNFEIQNGYSNFINALESTQDLQGEQNDNDLSQNMTKLENTENESSILMNQQQRPNLEVKHNNHDKNVYTKETGRFQGQSNNMTIYSDFQDASKFQNIENLYNNTAPLQTQYESDSNLHSTQNSLMNTISPFSGAYIQKQKESKQIQQFKKIQNLKSQDLQKYQNQQLINHKIQIKNKEILHDNKQNQNMKETQGAFNNSQENTGYNKLIKQGNVKIQMQELEKQQKYMSGSQRQDDCINTEDQKIQRRYKMKSEIYDKNQQLIQMSNSNKAQKENQINKNNIIYSKSFSPVRMRKEIAYSHHNNESQSSFQQIRTSLEGKGIRFQDPLQKKNIHLNNFKTIQIIQNDQEMNYKPQKSLTPNFIASSNLSGEKQVQDSYIQQNQLANEQYQQKQNQKEYQIQNPTQVQDRMTTKTEKNHSNNLHPLRFYKQQKSEDNLGRYFEQNKNNSMSNPSQIVQIQQLISSMNGSQKPTERNIQFKNIKTPRDQAKKLRNSQQIDQKLLNSMSQNSKSNKIQQGFENLHSQRTFFRREMKNLSGKILKYNDQLACPNQRTTEKNLKQSNFNGTNSFKINDHNQKTNDQNIPQIQQEEIKYAHAHKKLMKQSLYNTTETENSFVQNPNAMDNKQYRPLKMICQQMYSE